VLSLKRTPVTWSPSEQHRNNREQRGELDADHPHESAIDLIESALHLFLEPHD
jgi:hypothetical protein